MRFTVTGQAPAAPVVSDQASFFVAPELQPDVVADGTHALVPTITSAVARYDVDAIGEFVARSPITLRNANITNADSAATLASIVLRPVRIDPYGNSALDQVEAANWLTASDNQDTRVQVPIVLKLDGNTYLRVTNDANGTPASYRVAFGVALGMDRRHMAPDAQPGVVLPAGQAR
jgi:hypothetical protein